MGSSAGFKSFIITEYNWFGARHDGFAYAMALPGSAKILERGNITKKNKRFPFQKQVCFVP